MADLFVDAFCRRSDVEAFAGRRFTSDTKPNEKAVDRFARAITHDISACILADHGITFNVSNQSTQSTEIRSMAREICAMGTAAMAKHVAQFGMEPNINEMHDWLWDRYIESRKNLSGKFASVAATLPRNERLAGEVTERDAVTDDKEEAYKVTLGMEF